MSGVERYQGLSAIAIVGMSGRFPKAPNLDEFWRNLCGGLEAISHFSRDELVVTSYTRDVVDKPNYVRASGVLEDIELFDARFFGVSPREAQGLDPQHRVFLEVAFEALQNSGHDPERFPGPIGVYAGCDTNTYLVNNILASEEYMTAVGPFAAALGNASDFMPTRVSYELNLRGPSFSVQCACASTLAAAHIAIKGLLDYECDMALAGGVAIRVPQKMGYLAQEGGVFAPDGHCRPFDVSAGGFVEGSGAGVLVFRRLEDAIADGDNIWAVIRGSALNNDGKLKLGFSAPKRETQAAVVAAAQAVADVSPDTISYIETHGTGTRVGDPLEFYALKDVFGDRREDGGRCGLGSVKSNIGHLYAAAGAAGLIKTALSLKHGKIPPTINFREPNPEIDFEESPFRLVTELEDWPRGDEPRRAGVSAFGIGGSNGHFVLEEAPEAEPSGPSRSLQLLPISAKTPTALEASAERLRQYLEFSEAESLADVAFTLQQGRTAYSHRRAVVCRDAEDAGRILSSGDARRMAKGARKKADRQVVFLFTGQGAQFAGMGQGLYEVEPAYRSAIDRCAELLEPHIGRDLRELLHPSSGGRADADETLRQTAFTQPALFALEYSLARLWESWGVKPAAMIGHSIGEIVAACLAGVFDLEGALRLVAVRGRLMQELPSGSMLAVFRPEEEIWSSLGEDLSVAAVNGPSLTVVSGPDEAVSRLAERLKLEGTPAKRLRTSHAFHSAMMDPILEPFVREVEKANPSEPRLPFVSNVTGTWICPEEATDPGYWARHLRGAVRFTDGVTTLAEGGDGALLEVGPGTTLGSLARQSSAVTSDHLVLSSLPGPQDDRPDLEHVLLTLGSLWAGGVPVDWKGFTGEERRRRVPLPTYPFERVRCWVEPSGRSLRQASQTATKAVKRPDVSDWFYVPSWERSPAPALLPRDEDAGDARWLVLCDDLGVGQAVADRLGAAGAAVSRAFVGDAFARDEDGSYRLRPDSGEDHEALFADLAEREAVPDRIVHLWSVSEQLPLAADRQVLWDRGMYSLLALARGLSRRRMAEGKRIEVVTSGVQEVGVDDCVEPEKHALLGPCKVIPQEIPGTIVRSVDIDVRDADSARRDRLAEQLVQELTAVPDEPAVAYRHGHRWIQSFDNVRIEEPKGRPVHLREQGVYVITGGLGRIGLVVAERLARELGARLVLTGRSPLPARDEWESTLESAEEGDRTAQKIRQLLALEEAGAQVLPVSADVVDEESMNRVFEMAEEHFGAVHGVLHAAGSVGREAFQPVASLDRAACEPILRAKVDGLHVLARVIEGRELDFCVLASSLSAVLGGLTYAAYASANLFLNGFAQRMAVPGGTPWIALGWDFWGHDPDEASRSEDSATSMAMTQSEGVETLFRTLSVEPVPQLVVSTGNLDLRIDKWLKIGLKPADEPEEAAAAGVGPQSREEISTEFEELSGEVEEMIAALWAKVLGVDQVGANDDFFELGGHSLLAIQAVARVQEEFGVELAISDFFERATVRGLAEEVERRMIAEIEAMSDEEAERQLDGS